MNRFFFVIPLLLIASCVDKQSNTDVISAGNEFPIHGNFCGKEHPAYLSASPHEHALRIRNIPAQDPLDQACKNHDLCYAESGFGAQICDINLENDVMPLRFGSSSDRYCSVKRNGILTFARAKRGNYLDTAVSVPLVVMGAGIELSVAALDQSIDLIRKKPKEKAFVPQVSAVCIQKTLDEILKDREEEKMIIERSRKVRGRPSVRRYGRTR